MLPFLHQGKKAHKINVFISFSFEQNSYCVGESGKSAAPVPTISTSTDLKKDASPPPEKISVAKREENDGDSSSSDSIPEVCIF